MIGQTISHYKITAKLGEGGMGVVYKAEDTKLKRPVALKFIAANLIKDTEARKRFEREATAAAGVSHANVCHVYEIADADSHTFLAMEFVEGEGLDKRIERGPLPLKDALDLASQAAKGLAAAHAKGVVHRDIKPANLLVSADGELKILDFGLALLTEGSKLTQLDTKVGTVAYMSPEQAQGMEIDHRSDIWSLGCVLYEMVCGQRPFRGVYDQALLYEIINQEPEPLTGVRSGVPMELEWIVGKCLAKEPDARYRHADELAGDLKNLQEKLKSGRSTILRTTAAAAHAATSPPSAELDSQTQAAMPQNEAAAFKRKLRVAWIVAASAIIGLIALAAFVQFREVPVSPPPLRRFAITPPAAPLMFGPDLPFESGAAISPDGRYIAFATAGNDGRLWVHELSQNQSRPLAGTEGAAEPFWSPESDFIGFVAGPELKKVSVQGGPPARLCELGPAGTAGLHMDGASWSPDGETIVFSADHKLYEVSARGGVPNLLISPADVAGPGEPTGLLVYPRFLPARSGRALVYGIQSATDKVDMVVQDLDTGRRESLGAGRLTFYSPSGHIVYQTASESGLQQRRGSQALWALPFSIETLRATGEAFPIAESGRYPTVADDGTLVYSEDTEAQRRIRVAWFDRNGGSAGETGLIDEGIRSLALSPDGKSLAFDTSRVYDGDVWVYDVARQARTRLSAGQGISLKPVWAPDGSRVAFTSRFRGGGGADWFLVRQSDGGGAEEELGPPSGPGGLSSHWSLLSDWSRDGTYMLYETRAEGLNFDVWYLQQKPDGGGWESHSFLQTASNEKSAKFSPDGRYVAYVSDESGRDEIYVQTFPESGRRATVSNNGGSAVRWRRDGKEMFYVEGQTLMAVAVSTEGEFSAGRPTRLFEHPGLRPWITDAAYDVSPDGQRFVVGVPLEEQTPASWPKFQVVQNWFAEFADRQRK